MDNISPDFKTAKSISLYDAGIILSIDEYPEGPFFNYGRSFIYRIDGEQVKDFLKFIDFSFQQLIIKQGQDNKVFKEYLSEYEFKIQVQLSETDKATNLDEIKVRILSTNLLEICFIYDKNKDDQFNDYVTYSGSFAIEWDRES